MGHILITGGLGFIGSELAKYLFKQYKLSIFDKPRKEMVQYFADIPLNLIDRDHGIDAIYELDPDIIIHMGAKSSTDISDPIETYNMNTLFTNKLIDYSIRKNKKLIYASSAATYGDGSNGFQDFDNFYKLQKLKPLNLYGWSKHNSDLYLSSILEEQRNISNIIGLKFFNVYGKNEIHKNKMASVLSQKLKEINKGEEVILFKHYHHNEFCEAERDFIYVEDVAKIILKLIQIDTASTILNIGTGVKLPFSNLIKIAYRSKNLEPKINFIDLPKKYHGKYQMRTKAPIQKFKNLLPEFKFTNPEAAIKKML